MLMRIVRGALLSAGRTLLVDRRGEGDLMTSLLLTAAGAVMVAITVPSLFESSDSASRTFRAQVNVLERGATPTSGGGSGGGWNINVGPGGVSVAGGAGNVRGNVTIGNGGGGTTGGVRPAGGGGGGGGGSTQQTPSILPPQQPATVNQRIIDIFSQ